MRKRATDTTLPAAPIQQVNELLLEVLMTENLPGSAIRHLQQVIRILATTPLLYRPDLETNISHGKLKLDRDTKVRFPPLRPERTQAHPFVVHLGVAHVRGNAACQRPPTIHHAQYHATGRCIDPWRVGLDVGSPASSYPVRFVVAFAFGGSH